MKKLFAILLTLAMIFAMSATAFADETQTFDLTISGTLGHTYKVFQIYTGDVSVDAVTGEQVLSNVKYGQNHFPVDGNIGDPVPDAELQAFLNAQDPSDYFRSQTSGLPYAVINENLDQTSVTITVEAGYYLIVDATSAEDLEDGQTKSHVILKVSEDTTIASKHASIVAEKKVADTNDSYAATNAVWNDSADYDIGDFVPFQITITLPSTFAAYDDYELTIHDKQDAGFDLPLAENISVYILKKDNTTKYTIPVAGQGTTGYTYGDDCGKDTCEFENGSFNITINGIDDIYIANSAVFEDGDKIVVNYTSKLNENAVVGKGGNENCMYVCHPDGHTPIDYVTVFTYGLNINKVDGANGAPLNGADFTLFKQVNGAWVEVTSKTVNGNVFSWNGIDDGKYKLQEIVTPDGYNSIAPIEFEIFATHKDEWIKNDLATNSAFMDLIAKDASGTPVFADQHEGVEDGILGGNVTNHKGVVLPETGAEGTFMLITFGSILVVLAVVFMITRKKMSIYED